MNITLEPLMAISSVKLQELGDPRRKTPTPPTVRIKTTEMIVGAIASQFIVASP
jgi:hypothetical protein